MGSSRRRGTVCVRSREAAMPLQTRPRAESAAGALRELPRWMRLYFYGMHGVTLDVLLSSVQGAVQHRDPKLLGFSSVYLCIAHSLSHLALEKLYSQRKSFRGPVLFHMVIYPSIYIGLQLLIGALQALTWRSEEPVPRLSPHMSPSGLLSQLLLQYLVALYFAQVFHRGLSQLQYGPSCVHSVSPLKCGGPPRGLPGLLHFLFFGMHGFLDEVLFTSVFNLVEKADHSLSGHTSLWSFLMYGSCSFAVEKLYLHLHFTRGWGTCKRLPLYVCVAYTWELSWGLLLRQFGACSWDYSHYPLHFMGLVTLLYLPGWVCLSLYQDVLTNVLLRIKCTKVDSDGPGPCELNGQTQPSKKLT
ncbi:transmembrane protein 229A [Eucyclogobius newberryi]|uniref:transmembrane protein 229A n=1 Tax=Eucyclogobius newberryi TaxID=166745 RepID=UPI003B5C70C5